VIPTTKLCARCREAPSIAICTKCLRPMCRDHVQRIPNVGNRCPDCVGNMLSLWLSLLPEPPAEPPRLRRRARNEQPTEEGVEDG
jgi:hypothetical protein